MPPASCGSCHCTECAITKKPIKPRKCDRGPAQSLLNLTEPAQILRTPLNRRSASGHVHTTKRHGVKILPDATRNAPLKQELNFPH
jgi:hypothetical protein